MNDNNSIPRVEGAEMRDSASPVATTKKPRKVKKQFRPPVGWQPTEGWTTKSVHTARCDMKGCNRHVTDDNPVKVCKCGMAICWICEKTKGNLLHPCVYPNSEWNENHPDRKVSTCMDTSSTPAHISSGEQKPCESSGEGTSDVKPPEQTHSGTVSLNTPVGLIHNVEGVKDGLDKKEVTTTKPAEKGKDVASADSQANSTVYSIDNLPPWDQLPPVPRPKTPPPEAFQKPAKSKKRLSEIGADPSNKRRNLSKQPVADGKGKGRVVESPLDSSESVTSFDTAVPAYGRLNGNTHNSPQIAAAALMSLQYNQDDHIFEDIAARLCTLGHAEANVGMWLIMHRQCLRGSTFATTTGLHPSIDNIYANAARDLLHINAPEWDVSHNVILRIRRLRREEASALARFISPEGRAEQQKHSNSAHPVGDNSSALAGNHSQHVPLRQCAAINRPTTDHAENNTLHNHAGEAVVNNSIANSTRRNDGNGYARSMNTTSNGMATNPEGDTISNESTNTSTPEPVPAPRQWTAANGFNNPNNEYHSRSTEAHDTSGQQHNRAIPGLGQTPAMPIQVDDHMPNQRSSSTGVLDNTHLRRWLGVYNTLGLRHDQTNHPTQEHAASQTPCHITSSHNNGNSDSHFSSGFVPGTSYGPMYVNSATMYRPPTAAMHSSHYSNSNASANGSMVSTATSTPEMPSRQLTSQRNRPDVGPHHHRGFTNVNGVIDDDLTHDAYMTEWVEEEH